MLVSCGQTDDELLPMTKARSLSQVSSCSQIYRFNYSDLQLGV